MQIFSSALAEGGFEVYIIDLPGHGDSPEGFSATVAAKALDNALTYLGNETAVVGHSLGAGLLLDLATRRRFEKMVLLSPPPTAISKIEVDRLLVVTGDWDMPRINAFVPTLKALGGSNVVWRRLPWAAHSSAAFYPQQITETVQWLGGSVERIRTASRLVWLGILLASSTGLGICLLPGSAILPRRTVLKHVLLLYVAAGWAGIIVLKWFVVMDWIRLFATDYLVSFLLMTGLILYLTAAGFHISNLRSGPRDEHSHRGSPQTRNLIALAAAAYTIVVIGIIGGSQLFHLTLSNGRWWRFFFIVAAGFPLFLMDEVLLRPTYPRWKAAAVGVLTRLLLGAFVTIGVLMFNPQKAFLVLIIHLVVLFWMLLWFAAELVHRNTQSATAAALFAATVQGWVFAAFFVTM
jgi:hypothetical protein